MRLALIILTLALIVLSACADPPAEIQEKITPEERIQGTPIADITDEVQNAVKQGKKNIDLLTVLDSSESYKCTITFKDRIVALQTYDGEIREDVLWDDSSTIAIITDDALYRYSPDFQRWGRFSYSPEDSTSADPYTVGILSHRELKELEPGSTLCVKTSVNPTDFELDREGAFDVESALDRFDNIFD